jgi:hypothetical protein
MTNLRQRVTAAERAMGKTRPGLLRVLIVNDPEGLDVDDAQSGPSIEYRRLPNETVQAFRDRAARNAEARGERTILFGQQEKRESGFPIPQRSLTGAEKI